MNKHRIKAICAAFAYFLATSMYAQYRSVDLLNDTVLHDVKTAGKLFETNATNNTASVASVSGETLQKTVAPNLYNALSGQLSGLYVTQGDGQPGNENPRWTIRGVGSYGMGYYNSAKIFVDGFEVAPDYISYLSPSEIESVSVLKDAASLSTFGMRGANGVIWVKTKRGRVGKPTVTLSARTGMQQPINIYKPLDAYNFANLYNQAISNDNKEWTPYYSQSELDAYKNGTGTNVDWYNEALRKQGSYSDVDFVFNGGAAKARYNIVLSYANQQGLYNVQNTDQTSNQKMDRFNVRANFDFNIFDIVDASVDFGARLENRKQPNYWNLMYDLAAYPSNIYPVHDELVVGDETNFSGTTLYPNNPVGSIKGLGWYSTRARVIQGNFKFRERLDFITPGLYLQEAFSYFVRSVSGYGKTKNYARYFNGLPTTTDQTTSLVASGYGSEGMVQWLQGDIGLGYDRDVDLHALRSSINYHISDYQGEGIFNYKQRYVDVSGRFNYTYNNRYAAELGFSLFGSDAYAPGKRFGLYPSLSGAWILSNENFWENLQETVDFLKLRASVGLSGESTSHATNATAYDSQGKYLYQQYYAWSSTFFTGKSAPFTGQGSLTPLFLINPNVFAEKSLKYNVGIDANVLKKLHLTADFFVDKRSNILTKRNSDMNYYGSNLYFDNIGKMTNKGVEISAVYQDKVGKLNYAISGMLFHARNKIDFMDEVTPAFAYNAYTGNPYGTVMGLLADGLYELDDFNSDGTLKSGLSQPLFGAVQPGDIRYKDLDGDGFVDQTDVSPIGKSVYPTTGYSFGAQLTYEGFDFNILFQGASGASVNLMNHGSQFIAFVNNGNAYSNALNAWAYYPDQGIDNRGRATYPRLTTQSNQNNYQNSDYWIRDNNYLRIKNIELGYNLSHNLLKSNSLESFRIFLNATNPITWSGLLATYNMDPESGYGYPALKSFSAGLRVTF